MKIAYIITGLACGGAEAQLATVCSYLSREHHVKVFTLTKNRDLIHRFDGVDVELFDIRNPLDLVSLFLSLRKYGADIVHSHMVHANILSPVVAYFLNVPCMITAHNTNEGGKVRMEMLKFVLNLFTPAVSHVSNIGLEDYIRKKYCNSGFLYINPVSLSNFYNTNYSRQDLVRWINVASLSDQKRHDRLIKAFGKLVENFPSDTLYIYGEGDNLIRLENLVQELSLEDNVFLCGKSDDISTSLAESDYFVLSSDWEGLPVSVVEALAASLPIVTTDCGDVTSVVKSNLNGLVCEADDDELFEAMLKIRSQSDQDYNKMSSLCSESIKKFDVRDSVEKLLVEYKILISSFGLQR